MLYMRRALELAARGQGRVEPNPMVGCVIVAGDELGGEIIAEGWHRAFGGPHAEADALAQCGAQARGSTLYVTLEPCCHQGKTPPCTEAIIRAGVRRVIAAMRDPFPEVAGRGLSALEQAGVELEVGVLEAEARQLNAPYLKLLATARPWVIAKWAMTLDGKISARTGDSQWISSEASRAIVHEMRGRMDAIIVGRGTALADDPLLTARPAGPRVATRVVLDSRATLLPTSQLVRTADQAPVLVAVSREAPQEPCEALRSAGCEVLVCHGGNPQERLDWLLGELGRRRMTNVLVEGGGQVLGSLFDAGHVDEVHVFIAPKLVGGAEARAPLGGHGRDAMSIAAMLEAPRVDRPGGDIYVSGRIAK